jgi:hypothetical protein
VELALTSQIFIRTAPHVTDLSSPHDTDLSEAGPHVTDLWLTRHRSLAHTSQIFIRTGPHDTDLSGTGSHVTDLSRTGLTRRILIELDIRSFLN